MTLQEFTNGLRVLWCLSGDEYLGCINAEDREYLGDDLLLERFRRDPQKAFAHLPDQDQVRVFAIIEQKNKKAGFTP